MSTVGKAAAIFAIVIAIIGGYVWGRSDQQAGRVAPFTETAEAEKDEIDVYYPGAEELGKDEMRVVALGTGMPTSRPKHAISARAWPQDIWSHCHCELRRRG